jgi:hypothetical protein
MTLAVRAIHHCSRLTAFLALCLALGLVPNPARAAGATITAFYTTTKAAYTAWDASSGAPPPARTTIFPAGTVSVAYYLAYTGATPNATHVQIIERDAQGDSLKGNVHPLPYAAGSFADYFSHQSPAYAPGAYNFELLLDGVPAATARFSVRRGLAVPSFYTATKSAITAWQKSASDTPPKRTRFFPAGTVNVGYYFSFIGATPKVTTFHVNIYDASGALFIGGDKHTLHYATGYFGNYFYANKPSFPKGIYTMTVTMNGKLYKSTVFSVG